MVNFCNACTLIYYSYFNHLKSESKSKSRYDWRSVSHSVLVSNPSWEAHELTSVAVWNASVRRSCGALGDNSGPVPLRGPRWQQRACPFAGPSVTTAGLSLIMSHRFCRLFVFTRRNDNIFQSNGPQFRKIIPFWTVTKFHPLIFLVCAKEIIKKIKDKRIINEHIKEIMGVKEKPDIIAIIERKRLQRYGHVKRMQDERLPKLIMEWIPGERRKRGRPRKTWMEGVRAAMKTRHLEADQWLNRKEWYLGSGRRRRLSQDQKDR